MNKAIAICNLYSDIKNKNYLFECPAYTVQKGNEVIVQTKFGRARAIVKSVMQYVTEEDYDFACELAGIKKITGKVVSVMKERVLDYGECSN